MLYRSSFTEFLGFKCDERRPICSNCRTSERQCCYPGLPSPDPVQPGHPPSHSASPEPLPAVESLARVDLAEQVGPVNMAHAVLLYHFTSNCQSLFEMDFDSIPVSFLDITRCTLSAPYLLNEALALSALHLSITQPHESVTYKHQSVELQTHALSIFNTTKPVIDQDSCVGTFLFSSLLGVHLLCNSLVFREPIFSEFLDTFTQCLRLHQGVRAVAGRCWGFIGQTALAPILNAIEVFPPDVVLGDQCQKLYRLFQSADLGPSVTATIEQDIFKLQGVMHAVASRPTSHGSAHALVAWSVVLSYEYMDLLTSRQPEALVALAYYGALLHCRRDSWIFGDGGKYIIDSVNHYLGPAWEDALAWPNQILQETEEPL